MTGWKVFVSILFSYFANSHAWKSNQFHSFLNFKVSQTKFSKSIFGLIILSVTFHYDSISANAFDNAVSVVKVPKMNGPVPTNLGLDKNGLLRMCLKPSPNCFSTTPDILYFQEDDDDNFEASEAPKLDNHFIPKLKYTKGNSDEAFDIIGNVLNNYEPGQSEIDGGGWKIISQDKKKRYYYVQYESLKRGYIDDLEIAVNDDGTVQVVSSSRLGYLDFLVNSKRLNYISAKLKKLGFEVSDINSKTHPLYFESNVVWEGPGLGLGKKKF